LKRRSAASLSSGPPEGFTLFLDRGLGNKVIAAALRTSGVRTEVHSDHFKDDEDDAVWLREVGRRGWIVLTKDKRIRYRGLELQAIIDGNVRAFVLRGGEMKGQEMADAFVKALPKMQRIVEKQAPPFIAKVTAGGAVDLVWPA
jgi:predicted nuclease of predicted toxin-antitoxin system